MNSIGQDLDVSENFPDLPPFPNHVTTAPLLRISLKKLLDQNPAELSKLYDASVDIGFFYLDLRDAEQGQHLLDDADALFQVGERLFDLSLEEKQGYDFSSQKSYFGYKSQGVSPVDLDGNLDRAEFYNVGRSMCSSRQPKENVYETDRQRSPRTISWASQIRFRPRMCSSRVGAQLDLSSKIPMRWSD